MKLFAIFLIVAGILCACGGVWSTDLPLAGKFFIQGVIMVLMGIYPGFHD